MNLFISFNLKGLPLPFLPLQMATMSHSFHCYKSSWKNGLYCPLPLSFSTQCSAASACPLSIHMYSAPSKVTPAYLLYLTFSAKFDWPLHLILSLWKQTFLSCGDILLFWFFLHCSVFSSSFSPTSLSAITRISSFVLFTFPSALYAPLYLSFIYKYVSQLEYTSESSGGIMKTDCWACLQGLWLKNAFCNSHKLPGDAASAGDHTWKTTAA